MTTHASRITSENISCFTDESAFLFVTKKLWQKDTEKVELDICDQIVLEADKSISVWLFSSKEGQVKSKKKENRSDIGKIWDHISRVREFLDSTNISDNASSNNRSECFCYSVDNHNKQKWEAVQKSSILNRSGKVLLVVPTTQMQNSRLLKVDFRRDPENTFQQAKVKCFVPTVNHNKQHKMKSGEFPRHFMECHNNMYGAICANFSSRLAKILDSRSSTTVVSMIFYIYINEVEVESNLPVNSTGRYRAWLCFVEELSCIQIRRQVIDCSASVSSKLTKRLDPELHSQASLIKPWAFCMGDFCFFDENNGFYRKLGGGGGDGLDLGDDFDAITESKLAIKRHRPVFNGHQDAVDLMDESTAENGSGVENFRTAELSRVGIPTKSRTIMVKSILLAREEMDVMKGIDHQLTGDMIGKANSTNRMALKSQLEQIWPLSIARWWLNVGQQEQPIVPKVGKIPDALLKHIRADTIDASNLDAKERNKWFSWYYSQVKVCESCYFIYQELESFRQNKTKELQRNARFESEEYKMTAEQRREKDREIERRIFQQRKLMTRLSKCKSAPSLGENDNTQESLRSGNNDHAMPWKVSTRFNAESLHKRSIADHIMNKPIDHMRSNETDDIDVLRRWEQMTTIPEKPKLPPLRAVSKKPPKKMVNTNNYTANHLLHPWQRELGKLRQDVSNGKSIEEALQNGFTSTKQHHVSDTTNYIEEEDEDDENDFGELGWSPFVI